MRATAWLAFLLVLSAGSSAARSQEYWWQGEYPALLTKLADASGKRLATSYAVRDGKRVNLELREIEDRAVLLVIDAPGESLVSQDDSGNLRRATGRNVILITDVDRNGSPDTFTTGPSQDKQSSPLEVTLPEQQAIVATWGGGVGYGVNWFLHKVASATPR
jgi:hypothetical protein